MTTTQPTVGNQRNIGAIAWLLIALTATMVFLTFVYPLFNNKAPKVSPKAAASTIVSSSALAPNFCNLETTNRVRASIDNLTRADIDDFLNTFHSECRTEKLFNQASSPLLFDVLDKHTDETLSLLHDNGAKYRKDDILFRMKYPSHPIGNISELISKVKTSEVNTSTTKEVLAALIVARDTRNQVNK